MLKQSDLYDYVKAHLSLPRFLHSVRTADCAVNLCKRFGLPEEEGYVAGIAHDMAREIPDEQVLKLAQEDALTLLDEEYARPVLLHGRAAAVLMQSMWNVERETVLDAVRWHTQGHPEMGELGKVIYIADYIEPGRTHIDEDFRIRILHMNTLDEMVTAILEAQFSHLKEKGREISAYALQLYSVLQERQYAKI